MKTKTWTAKGFANAIIAAAKASQGEDETTTETLGHLLTDIAADLALEADNDQNKRHGAYAELLSDVADLLLDR